MRTLELDIETYSSAELTKCGVYAYADAPDFAVLLFGYAYDEEPARVVDLASGERLPDSVLNDLTDPGVLKTAYNAQFERVCLSRMLRDSGIIDGYLNPEQWECTQVRAAMLGLPSTLEEAGKALGIAEDKQKLAAGKALIHYFCKPCKPTVRNYGRRRNVPAHDPDKWELFKAYNVRDVEAERAIRNKLLTYENIRPERALYALDQRINDRGVKADMKLVENAIAFDSRNRNELIGEAVELTGLSNPNSAAQLKAWLNDADGIETTTLRKSDVPVLMEQTDNAAVKRVLQLRQQLSKTSIKKYEAMSRSVCSDGKAHGLLQFYGANRTGRWAGRIVQVQNLPRNKLGELGFAREVVRRGDYDGLDMMYDSVSDTLSQLVRTALIPSSGLFAIADFSAIEARVIAWLAGEKWRLDVFRTHGRIYEASASQMFRVPLENVTKDLRQKGKVAELALGYNGGPAALIAMGALDTGVKEDELTDVVTAWRAASPAIVRLWKDAERAAIEATEGKSRRLGAYLRFTLENDTLFIRLPSGRSLAYYRPQLNENKWGGQSLSYMGVNQISRKYERLTTYGGKLAENIVQGIARDCLAVFLMRLENSGYKTVFHVHDEAIIDGIKEPKRDLQTILQLMREPIDWAPGLPLKGEGFTASYYQKD